MSVSIDRSMNAELTIGAIDHTIRLRNGQDRGGIVDIGNYYNHLIGSDTSLGLTGEFLADDYLRGIVASPRPIY